MERQLRRSTLLVHLDRDVMPEVVAIVLRPKGRVRVPTSVTLQSPGGWARLTLDWRVVELWKIPAKELLRSGEPGLMPWIPLTEFHGRPEPVFRRCREVIDQTPGDADRTNLLAVTQVLAGLRYNDPGLLSILGGRTAMIESPVLRELEAEWKAEAKAEDVIGVLNARFGSLSSDLRSAILEVRDLSRLDILVPAAARCETIEEFCRQLHQD